jgi:hypothetical protein
LKESKSIIKNKLLLELDDLLVIKIIVVVAGLDFDAKQKMENRIREKGQLIFFLLSPIYLSLQM